MQQFNKKDLYRQCPIIRKVVSINQGGKEKSQTYGKVRDERFFSESDYKNINYAELTKQAILTKPDFFMIPPLIKNWYLRAIEIYNDLPYLNKLKCIIELAEIGIKNLGVILNQEQKAREITKVLKNEIDKIDDAGVLLNRIVYVYTLESFLYKVLNKNLRENDLSYLDDIGPFAFLVYEFIRYKQMYSALNIINDKSVEHVEVVWRSVYLPDEILNLYYPNVCPFFIWYSFTSTSAHAETVENFLKNSKLNTIFKIIIEKNIFCQTVNISEISFFKNEDEILLQAASVLEIVEHTVKNKIHYITLKLIPNKQLCQNFTIIKNQFDLLNNKWMWANGNPWKGDENIQWEGYNDYENYLIEYNYLQGQKNFQVGEYIINYEIPIQYHYKDNSRARIIKRVCQFSTDNLNFSYFKILINENIGKILSPLILFWYSKFILINKCSYLEKWKFVIDLIVDGILEESKLSNNQTIGMKYVNSLMITALNTKYSRLQIFKEFIKIYTDNSFFYVTINKALRNNDFSKLDTVGPFCFLFNELITYYDSIKIFAYHGKVYRGMCLDEKMIDYYKNNVGKNVYWPAFSSTSKKKQVAEMFGTNETGTVAIFEIHLDSRGVDVKALSSFLSKKSTYNDEFKFVEHEEEVLIHAGTLVNVVSYRKDDNNNRIYFSLSTFAY